MQEVSSQAPVPSSSEPSKENDERAFTEFRRKVRESEMLASSMVRCCSVCASVDASA